MPGDDDFVPRPVSPPQRAIPVGPASGKSPGVQQRATSEQVAVSDEAYARVMRNDHPMDNSAHPDPTRSARAKRSWKTRRKHQHDRHVVGDHPFDQAIARLYAERDRINDAIGLLEVLRAELK